MKLRLSVCLAVLIGGGALALAAVGRTAVQPPDRKAPTRPTVDSERETDALRPVFHFGSTDNRSPSAQLKFRCAIDTTTLHPCARIHRPFSALAFGPHLMRVRALDRAGNPSRIASYAFTVVGTWDAAADFAPAPHPENPGRDRYGNASWFYLYSGTIAHDPADYHALPTFTVLFPNVQHWHANQVTPLVGLNDAQIVTSPGHYNLGQNAILGWRSPVTSTVRLRATITYNSNPCDAPQDGIIWSIDHGATTLQSELLAPRASKTIDITTTVNAGDFFYLIINGATTTNCDTTFIALNLVTR